MTEELKTSVDKALMSQVAECFLKSVQTTSCMVTGCTDSGMSNGSGSGDLHPEGLYPFSVADPVKLDGGGWEVGDYVKGNTCEDIYELVSDSPLPITDPELDIFAADGTSLDSQWVNRMRQLAWHPLHPSSPYWNINPVPVAIDSGNVSQIVIYDQTNHFANTFSNIFGMSLPPIVYAAPQEFQHFTPSMVAGLVSIVRIGLIEATATGDVATLYNQMSAAISKIQPSGAITILCPPDNAPGHLIEAYEQIAEDFGCLYYPSSVPMIACDNTTVSGSVVYSNMRIAYWLMNEMLSKATCETLTMFSPNPTVLSVTKIIKHLDIEMRTP